MKHKKTIENLGAFNKAEDLVRVAYYDYRATYENLYGLTSLTEDT